MVSMARLTSHFGRTTMVLGAKSGLTFDNDWHQIFWRVKMGTLKSRYGERRYARTGGRLRSCIYLRVRQEATSACEADSVAGSEGNVRCTLSWFRVPP